MTTDALSNAVYKRMEPAGVDRTLARLGAAPSAAFRDFFQFHAGPFGSDVTGFSLLDLVDQDTNIETQTTAAREAVGLADRYLVISDLLGNGVLVYDCDTDAVFDMDFEGGDRELAEGRLAPRWTTFADFLRYYFGS